MWHKILHHIPSALSMEIRYFALKPTNVWNTGRSYHDTTLHGALTWKMVSWSLIMFNPTCADFGLITTWWCKCAHIHQLTHWGRVTHICVSELTTIGSDNGLSPGRRQAITWNNDGLLLIEYLGTNFSEISIGIQTFSFKKMHLNMSSAKWRPFCLGLNVLTGSSLV